MIVGECGALETRSITVTVDPPMASATSTPDNGGTNGTATASAAGGVPPYDYSWSNGMTGQVITGLASGSYSLIVTDSIGCVDSLEVMIDRNVGIEEDLQRAGIESIRLLPNPANSFTQLNVSLKYAQEARLQVFNSMGQIVLRRKLELASTFQEHIPTDQLAPGVYVVYLTTEYGKAYRRLEVVR